MSEPHTHVLQLSTPDMDDGSRDIECSICYEHFSTQQLIDAYNDRRVVAMRAIELTIKACDKIVKVEYNYQSQLSLVAAQACSDIRDGLKERIDRAAIVESAMSEAKDA